MKIFKWLGGLFLQKVKKIIIYLNIDIAQFSISDTWSNLLLDIKKNCKNIVVCRYRGFVMIPCTLALSSSWLYDVMPLERALISAAKLPPNTSIMLFISNKGLHIWRSDDRTDTCYPSWEILAFILHGSDTGLRCLRSTTQCETNKKNTHNKSHDSFFTFSAWCCNMCICIFWKVKEGGIRGA